MGAHPLIARLCQHVVPPQPPQLALNSGFRTPLKGGFLARPLDEKQGFPTNSSPLAPCQRCSKSPVTTGLEASPDGLGRPCSSPKLCVFGVSLGLQVCKQYLLSGRKSVNSTYFGPFGAPGLGFRISGVWGFERVWSVLYAFAVSGESFSGHRLRRLKVLEFS